jgi:AcrR family transcriptional regulator
MGAMETVACLALLGGLGSFHHDIRGNYLFNLFTGCCTTSLRKLHVLEGNLLGTVMKELTIPSVEIQGREPKRRGNRATRVPEILEVAIRVFASEGSAGFTQTRVAGDAGIRLSTLQHYFGTRENLLQCTIKEMAKRYLERYRVLAKNKVRSPEARLDAVVDDVFAELTNPASTMSAFALQSWSLAESEAFVNELMAEINGEFQELFAGLIAKVNPTLTSGECTLRGALILSHVEGLMVYIRRTGENLPDLATLRVATKAVWKALSAAP